MLLPHLTQTMTTIPEAQLTPLTLGFVLHRDDTGPSPAGTTRASMLQCTLFVRTRTYADWRMTIGLVAPRLQGVSIRARMRIGWRGT